MKKIYLFNNKKSREIKDKIEQEYEIVNEFKNIPMAQVFIVICNENNTELGYEMATALEKYSKPTLVLTHKDTEITRFLEGIDHPMYEIKQYSSVDEIPNLIKGKVEKHFPSAPESAPALADDTCDVCAV